MLYKKERCFTNISNFWIITWQQDKQIAPSQHNGFFLYFIYLLSTLYKKKQQQQTIQYKC